MYISNVNAEKNLLGAYTNTYGSITILIAFILGSRCLLSAAFTKKKTQIHVHVYNEHAHGQGEGKVQQY